MSDSASTGRRRWVSAVAISVFLVGWELTMQLALVDPILLSSPSRIVRAALELLSTGDLYSDTMFTVRVFFTALAIAVVCGLLIGCLIGVSSLAYDAFNPFIVTASALPKIVLMPLIVLWLGIGFVSNVFLATLMGSFPIIMATYSGITSLDRNLVMLARAYRASRRQLIVSIVLPAITPFVLGGLRVAVSYAMVGALIAEFFASSEGLGYRMVLYMSNFLIDEFFVCICMVAVLTLACGGAVHWLERRVEAWRPSAFQLPGM